MKTALTVATTVVFTLAGTVASAPSFASATARTKTKLAQPHLTPIPQCDKVCCYIGDDNLLHECPRG
jgi:hypothetical protein